MLPMTQVSPLLPFHKFKRNGARFSGKTVEKVLAAKERLNYQPDYFAQRMVMKSKTIGVIVPDITNPFFAQLIRGVKVFYTKKILY